MNESLPQSPDAEKGLLGSILLSPTKVMDQCEKQRVDDQHFHHPIHARIFRSLSEMRESGRPIDLITMTQFLEDRGALEEAGGAIFVTELFTFVPTASNAEYYIRILKEKFILRKLISACTEYEYRAREEQGDPGALVTEADAALTELKSSLAASSPVTRKTLLEEYIDEKEQIATGQKKRELLQCPLHTINDRVGGYLPGEITLIAGPPNSGKSLLGMEHVIKGCLHYGHPSAIFTGEMPYRQYMDRIICNFAEIPSRVMRDGVFNDGHLRKFISAQGTINDAFLEIYDQKRNQLTLSSIESEIRQLHKLMGLKIVLIDYLQRLNIEKRKEMRRDEELGYATTRMKALAVELDLWIFILSATNDEGQVRDSRGPEYDADNIISVLTDKNKVTQKIFIPKWRDGEKSYSVDVEVVGNYCQFREKLV